jgi:hypothetical protein
MQANRSALVPASWSISTSGETPADTKELVKPNPGVEEVLHALSEEAGCCLRPEAYSHSTQWSARPRHDDSGVMHGRKVAVIRLAEALDPNCQVEGIGVR